MSKSKKTNANTAAAQDDKRTALEWALQVKEWPGKPDDDPKLFSELIRRMNAEHAAVLVGGKLRYAVLGRDTEGRRCFVLTEAANLREHYRGVTVRERNGKPMTPFCVWAESPDRRYCEGAGLFPGSPENPPKVPTRMFNLWRGYGVEPKKGDWSLFRDHIKQNMCGGIEEHFGWLMD